MARIITSFIIALLLTGCFRNDMRTEVFYIEQLRTRQDAQVLIEHLKPLSDPKKNIHIKLDERTLTIEYDSKLLKQKNIEYAIIAAGFTLPNWPKNAEDRERITKADKQQ